MYSRFLREAAEITGDTLLSEIAAEFQRIGERWTEVAHLFRQAAEAGAFPSLAGDKRGIAAPGRYGRGGVVSVTQALIVRQGRRR
ncbi:MAG: hypothetical protein DRI61_14030 [Chloroflexi bacterium]|nr:MAG: hypothetical protein DRI61_14030 [Chloroflexota bacterium]